MNTDPRPQFVPENFLRGKGTLYSLSREGVGTAHYGSRGIILMTILQSWSQGVEVWSQRYKSPSISLETRFAGHNFT